MNSLWLLLGDLLGYLPISVTSTSTELHFFNHYFIVACFMVIINVGLVFDFIMTPFPVGFSVTLGKGGSFLFVACHWHSAHSRLLHGEDVKQNQTRPRDLGAPSGLGNCIHVVVLLFRAWKSRPLSTATSHFTLNFYQTHRYRVAMSNPWNKKESKMRLKHD